jgi:hypothetical protein
VDVLVHRIVVIALAVIALLCVGGQIYLEAVDKQPSVVLASTLTGCIGALVGILAPNRAPAGGAAAERERLIVP